MLLPSSASFAEEAVSESVNCTSAYHINKVNGYRKGKAND